MRAVDRGCCVIEGLPSLSVAETVEDRLQTGQRALHVWQFQRVRRQEAFRPPLVGARVEQGAGGEPDPQGGQVVAEAVSAGGGQAEPGGEEVLQFLRVADALGTERLPQRAEVGVEVAPRLRGPGGGARGDDGRVRGGGHARVQAYGGRPPCGDRLGLAERVPGRGGDGCGDPGAQRGEYVQHARVQSVPGGGGGEAGHGGRPGRREQRTGQVGDDGDPLGQHLGGAEEHGGVRVVQGVAPGFVADQVQSLTGGGLDGLVQQLGRRDGTGGVVGDGQHQQAGVAALRPDPADRLQEGVRVRYATGLGGRRYVEDGPAQQSCVRCPPGGAGAGHQDVAAQRGGQRQEQGARAGAAAR